MNRTSTCLFCLVSLMFLSACSTVETPQQAQEGDASAQDPTRIQLMQPLHFSAPDGSDVVVGSGMYRLEQTASSQLRLSPTGDGPSTVLGANTVSSDLDVAAPIALAIPSQQPDAYHLALLLPGGTALDAIGSVTGVQPRGVFDLRKDIISPLATQFEVPQPPGPDLWLRSLSRPCPYAGNVFFVVINSGTEAAGPSTTRVEMGGARWATVPTNALAPGQSQGYSVYDSCSAVAGGGDITCSVTVRVDVQNAVAESNEINNTRRTTCTH